MSTHNIGFKLTWAEGSPVSLYYTHGSGVRPSVVVRPFTFSNVFSSETALPIKAKFYLEPPWEGGTKVYINGPGHMTKMAAMPIYSKNPSKILSRTWCVALGTPAHQTLY